MSQSSSFGTIFGERAIGIILIAFFAIGLWLFVIVQTSLTSFRADDIRKAMVWAGNSIVYFCDINHDQLAKIGAAEDPVLILLKQVETLETVEDYARNNNFEVEVYDVTGEKPYLLVGSGESKLLTPEKIVNYPVFQVIKIEHDDVSVNGLIIPFDPWRWKIVLIRDTKSVDNLLERLRGFYLALAILAAMITLLLILFLRHSRASAMELSRTRWELQDTLDSLVEGVVVVDSEGVVDQLNPAAKKIAGFDGEQEITGMHICDFLRLTPAGISTPLQPTDFQVGGVFTGGHGSGEYTLTTDENEGRLVDVKATSSRFGRREDEEASLVLSISDITDHRQVEKQLHQAQKMEAVGLMAGGVAHDLNNILSGVVSYPDLILLRLPPDSELRGTVEAIKKSGERAAAVVADMLTVARGAATIRETISINNMVKEYCESPECLKMQIEYPGIRFTMSLDSSTGNVSCSPVHVKKCFLNLMLNAFEAIGVEGECSISTRKGQVGVKQATLLQIEAGDYDIVTISDNGPGIDGEDIIHIFEPFYTRKKMGRSGTGLGLSVVWNSMQDHQGTVVVQSGSYGTVFDLYFPSVEVKKVAEAPTVSLQSLKGNGQTVLVIDDDPLQRDIASDFLNELNYRPTTASSGEEALELTRFNDYDLLLLDMIMDLGIDGRQTYEQILNSHPSQKALIVSGFSESEEVKQTMQLGAGGFIRKPYSLIQLGLALQEILKGQEQS